MKRTLLLLICISCIAVTVNAQTCPIIDGLSPVVIRYGANDSNFPIIPMYWSRFFKVNESTGVIEPVTCVFTGDPNIHEYGYCVCFLTGIYLRMVTDVCDATPCGGYAPSQPLPKTNNGSGSSGWSQGATWTSGTVPDLSSSIAALITKSVQIDQDINMTKDHWLSFSAGNSSILPGTTVVCNSVIQVYNGAQLENFGTLKGSGQIQGTVTNSGVLSPGNSPGKFTIMGNYIANVTAVHQIEIAASDLYDTINVGSNGGAPGGQVTLNGTLNVGLLNGYSPSSGDVYKIMTYTSATGTFNQLNLPALRPGLSWAVNYNVNDITLQVNGVLPVSIVSFAVNRKNKGVQADWTTASELGVKEYQVQRSADGISFKNAGTVAAEGSATNQYSFVDAIPFNGKNYYRLKAVDLDGQFKYSKVLTIDISDNAGVRAYPNPVKHGQELQLNIQNSVAAEVKLMNNIGQVLYIKKGALSGLISIPVSSLWPFGQYLLQVTTGKQIQTQKILIR